MGFITLTQIFFNKTKIQIVFYPFLTNSMGSREEDLLIFFWAKIGQDWHDFDQTRPKIMIIFSHFGKSSNVSC